jgi:hypothetical protein
MENPATMSLDFDLLQLEHESPGAGFVIFQMSVKRVSYVMWHIHNISFFPRTYTPHNLQGSVLSSFLYNFIESCADRFVPAGCGFLQYADNLVVYVTQG